MLVTFWLATRPYVGLVHDSRIYMFEALARLSPALRQDLLLRFGSQDSFSVYGYLLSRVVMFAGISTANMAVSVSGQLLWLFGAYQLVRIVAVSPACRVAAMATVIALPSNYGGLQVFHYAESFPTPRIFVEALVLFSIASALRGAWWRSGILLVLASMLHPLMTAPGVGLVLALATQRDRRLWLLPCLGVVLAVGLAFAGAEPFIRLRQTISGDWWYIVARRSRYVLLPAWGAVDFARLIFQASVASLLFWHASTPTRHLLKALALVVSSALLISLVGASLMHNLFIINVQLDRATWLLSCVVNLLAGRLLLPTFALRPSHRGFLLVGLGLYAGSRWCPTMIELAAPMMLATVVAMRVERRTAQPLRFFDLSLFAIAVTVCLLAPLLMWLLVRAQLHLLPMSSWWLLNAAVSTATVIGAAVYFWGYKALGGTVIAFTLVTCVLCYNQRSPWQQLVEDGDQPLASAKAFTGGAPNVYWEGGVELLWFNLHRQSYFSSVQGAGSMFYSRTAREYHRRGLALSFLNASDFTDSDDAYSDLPKADRLASGPRARQQLESVCKALPELDLIILATDVPGTVHQAWKAPIKQYVRAISNDGATYFKPVDRYYRYDCLDLR